MNVSTSEDNISNPLRFLPRFFGKAASSRLGDSYDGIELELNEHLLLARIRFIFVITGDVRHRLDIVNTDRTYLEVCRISGILPDSSLLSHAYLVIGT